MAGESVATTVVSMTRIITKASTNSERFGAIAFFVVSIIFIMLCVVCHQIIRTSPFVRYSVQQCSRKSREGEREGEGEEIRLERVDGEDKTMLLSAQREKVSLRIQIRGDGRLY